MASQQRSPLPTHTHRTLSHIEITPKNCHPILRSKMMTGPSFLTCCTIAFLAKATLAFLPHQSSLSPLPRYHSPSTHAVLLPTTSIKLSATPGGSDKPVEITFPTPEAAASMGIRDWPQQFHSATWSDSVSEGSIATRYVLDGKGRVTIDYVDNNGELCRIKSQRVYPGTLVEVDGEANLLWEVDDEKEGMIVLTPSYEEGGKLIIVGGFLLMFCAGLLVGSGGL